MSFLPSTRRLILAASLRSFKVLASRAFLINSLESRVSLMPLAPGSPCRSAASAKSLTSLISLRSPISLLDPTVSLVGLLGRGGAMAIREKIAGALAWLSLSSSSLANQDTESSERRRDSLLEKELGLLSEDEMLLRARFTRLREKRGLLGELCPGSDPGYGCICCASLGLGLGGLDKLAWKS